MEEFNNTLKDGEANYEEHVEMIPRDKNWSMIVQRVNKPSYGSQTVSVAKNYYLCEMRCSCKICYCWICYNDNNKYIFGRNIAKKLDIKVS